MTGEGVSASKAEEAAVAEAAASAAKHAAAEAADAASCSLPLYLALRDRPALSPPDAARTVGRKLDLKRNVIRTRRSLSDIFQ